MGITEDSLDGDADVSLDGVGVGNNNVDGFSVGNHDGNDDDDDDDGIGVEKLFIGFFGVSGIFPVGGEVDKMDDG